MHAGRLRRYRFVVKHLISGSSGKKISVKKRDVDDF
jgi:hypothetical protein